MFETLDKAVQALERIVVDLEPELYPGSAAVRYVDLFAKGERLCRVGKARMAKRATDCHQHQAQGHSSPASWLAHRTGESREEAARQLGTAEAMGALPEAGESYRRGQLSEAQAREVARGAKARPAAEKELLRLAEGSNLTELKHRANQVRAEAASAEEEQARFNRIRASRYLRHWTDADGAFGLQGRFDPVAGARLLSHLRAEADAVFHDARTAGQREPLSAYMADALISLVTGRTGARSGRVEGQSSNAKEPGCAAKEGTDEAGKGGSGPSARAEDRLPRWPSTEVVVRVDATALRRGSVGPGEVCEIPGVGSVPVATARSLLGDAVVKLVIVDGVDVISVTHLGRHVPAHLRTALEERDRTCCVPGCSVSQGLEIDHLHDYALGGATALSNLARMCARHHDMKTYSGWRLEGGPGAWQWLAPLLRSEEMATYEWGPFDEGITRTGAARAGYAGNENAGGGSCSWAPVPSRKEPGEPRLFQAPGADPAQSRTSGALP
jgi:hypothetical protein